ncbi:hypothetical protein [Stenotrophomonas maltophilia]|uniref:hypothetical protein n=1 Tax=Stenotrophomonas maltophilia TaxID=40324 RepID=UPI00066B7C92|nr:hypothetical protein [Stenotrophomonas maltophilia]MDH0793331.1 hypothetical protein [Stenotrophomonas maltophilia]
MTNNTHIAHNIDFDLARDRLDDLAGVRFRSYLELREAGKPEATIHAARVAYLETSALRRSLKPTDTQQIKSILESSNG